jgi:ABC-type Fe3+-siderophore transport system permease subunit
MLRTRRAIAGLAVVAVLFLVMLGCWVGIFMTYDHESSGHQVPAFYFSLMGSSLCGSLIATILLVLLFWERASRRLSHGIQVSPPSR